MPKVSGSCVVKATQVAKNALVKAFETVSSFCIDGAEKKAYNSPRDGVENVFDDLV